jgi:hypothetical protein
MSFYKKLRMINRDKDIPKESWSQNFPKRCSKSEGRTSPLVSSDIRVEKLEGKTVCKLSSEMDTLYQRFVTIDYYIISYIHVWPYRIIYCIFLKTAVKSYLHFKCYNVGVGANIRESF